MLRPLSRRQSKDGTPAQRRSRESGWSTFRFILGLALLAWAVRSFIVAPFSIPSGSMLPTLYVGDYLMVAKWTYGYSRYSLMFGFPSFEGRIFGRLPARGDVVVFRHPVQDSDLIKRVIGLPGDTVEIKAGAVILNGKPLARQPLRPMALPISPNSPCKMVPPATPVVTRTGDAPACLYRGFRETLPGGRSYAVLDQVDDGYADSRTAVQVPAGHLFLMGDNRDDSLDSRFAAADGGIGLVPLDYLIGRALITFWSTDGSASYVKPWTWFTALRANRIGGGYETSAR